jgi:hypothetical protein
MNRKVILRLLALISLLVVSACDLVIPTLPVNNTPPPTTDPQQAIDRAVTETLAAETLIAGAVEGTLQAMKSDTPQPTATTTLTLTPSVTPSLTFTLTPSFTFTPYFPTVTVSAETNCRSGPSRLFDLLATLKAGDSTQVVGRTTVLNYWLVRTPGTTSGVCWLWGQYATISGDVSTLPIATSPATPTPLPGFKITFLNMITCGDRSFRFEIKNSSEVTWQSIRIILTDTVTSTNLTYTSDTFKDYSGCTLTNTLLDLETDETGVVVNENPADFTYNPAGHEIKAVFTLFANNGLTGYSESTTITFKP